MADHIGTVQTVTGDTVSVRRSRRLDWIDTGESVLVAGDDVVVEFHREFAPLRPAMAVRLAALLLTPVDECEFTEGLGQAHEPDQEAES